MNKELQAIENSITQWTFYAETRAEAKSSYPPLKDLFLINSCYLCQYSCEKSGTKNTSKNAPDSACHACPYYKKYGFCDMTGKPYYEWCWGNKAQGAQAFLEQLKTLRTPIRRADVLIETLEAQLAEAKDIKATLQTQKDTKAESDEKPKPLEHGDYGIYKGETTPMLIMDNGNASLRIAHDDGLLGNIPPTEGDYNILGNIFKELAALKPKKEFEIADVAVSLDKDYVRIEGDGYTVYVGRARFHDFIHNLRCMELQMIQDAAKQ